MENSTKTIKTTTTTTPKKSIKQKSTHPREKVFDTTTHKRIKPKGNLTQKHQEIGYKVPECAHMYLSALVNPYDTPAGACIPADLFPIPSSKVKSFVRGRMVVGLQGIGFVACVPSFGNTTPSVYATTAASVGATTALFSAFTNTNATGSAQLPYAAADFTSDRVSGRLVSYGLRTKYVGQLMTRNGVCVSYEDPDHANCNRLSFDSMNSNPYSHIHRVGDEDWDSEVNYSGPVDPNEIEFRNVDQPLGLTFASMIAVSGIAGDVYEFEYYQHSEFIGTVVPNKTPSHADGASFGKAMQAVKTVASEGPITTSSGPSVWNKFVTFMKESLPSIVQIGGGIAQAMLTKGRGGGSMIMAGAAGLIPRAPQLLNGSSVKQLTN
jgi:hypothetical protein